MVKTNYFFSTPVVPIGLDVGLTNMLMSFWTFYLSRCCLDIVLFNHIYVKKLLMYLIIHPKKKNKTCPKSLQYAADTNGADVCIPLI
jgi:hypothetical protein